MGDAIEKSLDFSKEISQSQKETKDVLTNVLNKQHRMGEMVSNSLQNQERLIKGQDILTNQQQVSISKPLG